MNEANAELIIQALGGIDAIKGDKWLLQRAETAAAVCDADGIEAALQYISRSAGGELLYAVRGQ